MRSYIVSLKLYLLIRYFYSALQFLWLYISPKKPKVRAYCISPYKTGTTFVSGVFSKVCISKHEPFQHLSLLLRHSRFFMELRSNKLGCDLEASGFLADSLSTIRSFSPDTPVLFIFRDFESWVKSLIVHQKYLSEWQGYPYTSRLFIDKISGIKIETFFNIHEEKQLQVITNLFTFWERVYSDALLDDYSLIIPLNDFEARIDEASIFLNLPSPTFTNNVWKRPASRHSDFDFNLLIKKAKLCERITLINSRVNAYER